MLVKTPWTIWVKLTNTAKRFSKMGMICIIHGIDVRYAMGWLVSMGLLPDTENCGLHMRRKCWERFPRHRLQRKPLVSDPGMHHGTCVTHVLWWMSGLLNRGGGESVPGVYTSGKRPIQGLNNDMLPFYHMSARGLYNLPRHRFGYQLRAWRTWLKTMGITYLVAGNMIWLDKLTYLDAGYV